MYINELYLKDQLKKASTHDRIIEICKDNKNFCEKNKNKLCKKVLELSN